MEDLLFDVDLAELFLPECIEYVAEPLELDLMMLELLLEESAVAGDVLVTRSERRCVGSPENGDVAVKFAETFLDSHQLLAELLQLGVEGSAVVRKWTAAVLLLVATLRRRSLRGLRALFTDKDSVIDPIRNRSIFFLRSTNQFSSTSASNLFSVSSLTLFPREFYHCRYALF